MAEKEGIIVLTDDEGKEVYVYHDYQPEKDIFLAELCQVAKFLESENYAYTFIDYTKYIQQGMEAKTLFENLRQLYNDSKERYGWEEL